MVETKLGDLFGSTAQTLVNTVNCVGVMGKGVALEFRKRFPEMFEDYVKLCAAGKVRLGEPYLYRRLVAPWILNFPTKEHWRSVSRLEDIVRGLQYLEVHYQSWGITSLAVPPLGCGQGGLEWRVVGPTLYRYLSHLQIDVELFAPHGTPATEIDVTFLGRVNETDAVRKWQPQEPHIRASWVALVEIVARVLREPYHWAIGRTSFQKIAYFATQEGLPTSLGFRRGSFGPFAEELKPMITKLVNNGLLRERKLGKMLALEPGPTYVDSAKAFNAELKEWEPIIDRITDLFLRIQTNQAEIAATVHFAALAVARKKRRRPTENEVLEEVFLWKQKRRPPLQKEEVARAIRGLNLLRWVDLQVSESLPGVETVLTEP